MKNDPVNNPAHYTDGKIEVIHFIEDKNLPYHLGNTVKYIARSGKKDEAKTIEDLKKAQWYLNRYIDLLEAKQRPPKSRCCDMCNGVDDICYADMTCEEHNETGCRGCWSDPE